MADITSKTSQADNTSGKEKRITASTLVLIFPLFRIFFFISILCFLKKHHTIHTITICSTVSVCLNKFKLWVGLKHHSNGFSKFEFFSLVQIKNSVFGFFFSSPESIITSIHTTKHMVWIFLTNLAKTCKAAENRMCSTNYSVEVNGTGKIYSLHCFARNITASRASTNCR